MTIKWFASLLCAVAFTGVSLLSAAAPAAAQDGGSPAAQNAAPDANGPGVARVSIVKGSVVVQRGDSKTQVAAVVNAPLLPGDYISTGPSSRAEVQLDGSTAVRLGGGVQARITSNDPNGSELQLADGTIEVSLIQSGAPVDVDTPSVTVRATDKGAYRITIDKDGATWVTVRHGQAQIVTPQQTYTLDPGKTLVARGDASTPSIAYTSEVGYDSFDKFNDERDATMIAALSANPNLNPSIAGYDNLDAYGQWQDVSGYGQAWIPNEPAGWAPYRNGSWAWEDGYGWTWVGSEPWGWTPYHYGRWFYANGYGWAWSPPGYAVAAAWSPALVGFFGFGAGVSVGFGFGSIGWCPLAPYEPYYPWYSGWAWNGYGWGWNHGGYGYYGGWGSHVVNITKITNIYHNSGHHGASGTLVGNFKNGNFSHNVAVDPKHLGHAGQLRGALPVAPGAKNLRYAGTTASHPVAISKRFEQSRFASNKAIASRTPFTQQQKTISHELHSNATARANAPITHQNAPVARQNAPVMHQNAPVARLSAPSNSWDRFNQNRGGAKGAAVATHAFNAGSVTRESASSARAPSGSWSRFAHERGNVAAPSAGRGAYASQSRGSYSAASRGSYPSYSRGTYSAASRGSYPSYSRGSYSAASRASYPSYSRGSYSAPSRGSYSAPSRGSYSSAPRSYSGGGGGGGRSGGGGGGARSGGGGGGGHGGRPPHS